MVFKRLARVSGAPAGLEAAQEVLRFKAVVAVALRNVWSLKRKLRAELSASALAFVGKLRVCMM